MSRTTLAAARTVSITLIVLVLLAPSGHAHLLDDCPEVDHCTADAQCNDRDPCTSDVCEPAGDGAPGEGCCTHEAITPCVDAFLCYDVVASKGSLRAAPGPGVRLVDWLEDLRFAIREPRELCTPADREGDGIHDPVTHLDRRRIVPTASRAPRVTAAGVLVETVLGPVLLDVIRGDKLAEPAAVDRTILPPALAQTRVDRFKCYDVKPGAGAPRFPKGLRLTLADAFTAGPRTFDVLAPEHLCAAADEDGEGVRDACAALLCYAVKASPRQPRFARVKGIQVRDRFTVGPLDVVGEDEACLPAVVNGRTCLQQAFACETDAECSTNHCVDGVCCETACDAPCYACLGSLTGEPHGACAPVVGGAGDCAEGSH